MSVNQQLPLRTFPRSFFVLFDVEGEVAGVYTSAADADYDAVGPRFRRFRVVRYDRTAVKP